MGSFGWRHFFFPSWPNPGVDITIWFNIGGENLPYDDGVGLSFSYIVVEPEDHRWGIETEKGRYDGMLGQLTRKVYDLLYHKLLF